MQYLSILLPVAAMVSGAVAGPALGDKGDDCLAAVTGAGALGDAGLRASHCASYLATTVTPIVTETVTITGNANDNWKRATVAYCPNEVPNYASACDDAHYTSACYRFGYTDVLTTTVAATTTTKTIWVRPGGASCAASTVTVGGAATVTNTVTVVKDGSASWSASTVTVTKDGSASWSATTVTVSATPITVTVPKDCPSATYSTPASSCNVDDALATKLVTNFVDLLQHTSYAGDAAKGIPAGQGYDYDVSAATLDPDFIDISDSINFMAGFPLGSISFTSKANFDYGQGVLQPEVGVNVLNIWHDCNSITWRWNIYTLPYPVTGINHMLVNDAGLVYKNYAEFDNGAWLESAGQNCSFATPPTPVAQQTKRGLAKL